MLEIDTEDEAIIDAGLATVRQAIIDETAGRTHWWLPEWQARPRGGAAPDHVGAMVDITVRKGVTVRFTARMTEIDERHIRSEYVAGAYRGIGTWEFEPVDGKTRARFRWRVRPTGWLSWLIRLEPARRRGQAHHQVMVDGFTALTQHLAARQSATSR